MAVKPSMRTSLALMTAKLEVTRGVDPIPTAAADAFLVGNLDIQLDPTLLERNVFRPSFSPIPEGVGRKIMNVTFDAEVKGSGDAAVRPRLGTLLRGCGMRELLVTSGAATQIAPPVVFGSVVGPAVSWALTTAPSSRYGSYLVEVVTGGASATAELAVSRWTGAVPDLTVLPNTRHDARMNDTATMTMVLNATDRTSLTFTVAGTFTAGDDFYAVIGGVTFPYTSLTANTDVAGVATAIAALIDADTRLAASASAGVITVTFTSGALPVATTSGSTAIELGASAAEITPTWSGNLVVGQKWIVNLYEEGYTYFPTSRQALTDTITLYAYKDGVLHKITACNGTVTFNGEAGNLSQASFEFQGNYIEPFEEPTPLDAAFEQTLPPQVELAQMSINGDGDFCAQSFTIALGNTINPKECMNAADGYDGSQITGREPTAQLNPEATYEAYTGMWGNFSKNVEFPLHIRVGTAVGNTVRFFMDRVTFTGLTYGDRNNTVTLETSFQLNGLSPAGDDELRVSFH